MARLFLWFIVGTFSLLFNSDQAFAAESTNAQHIQSSVLSLLEKQDSSVSGFESDGKVYFKAEAIVSTEKGMFLKTESGDYLRIPLLYSGERGAYMMLEEVNSTVYPVIHCINCGVSFSPTIFNRGKCPKCGTQN